MEDALQEWEGEEKREKRTKTVAVLTTLKAFAAKHQGTEKKKNQSSDKARG